MDIKGWRYYNHAAIPTTPPHEEPDTAPVRDGRIWKLDGAPLLARWTTDFDCGHETGWWYVIKDTPFDLLSLKAKRRYEINKGVKSYETRVVDPCDYKEALYEVQIAAFSAYPEKYRPTVERESFLDSVAGWTQYTIIGAFQRETGELSGYALLQRVGDKYVDFSVLKTKPEHEKAGVNAALVAGVLQHFDAFLADGGILCDGARSINHETAFQDYLEKYFCFRKAYCRLHIDYKPKIRWLIGLLYPFRKLFIKLDGIGIIHQMNAILKMEEIHRKEASFK
ncbi:MAG: hypothetical protein E7455_02165 [Ruminococcaceae bacterium]|nr:hypothetical protein [Oscillospiraceae bacterium]